MGEGRREARSPLPVSVSVSACYLCPSPAVWAAHPPAPAAPDISEDAAADLLAEANRLRAQKDWARAAALYERAFADLMSHTAARVTAV